MVKQTEVVFLAILFSLYGLAYALTPTPPITPDEIVNRVAAKYALIKDAEADVTLDTGLQLLGCGGAHRQKGKFWFKYPDRLKFDLEGTKYFLKGNDIRKITPKGKKYYIRLIHAPDLAAGFRPELITHNFYLKIINSATNEVTLEGSPKPGVLKNVKKVLFIIDTGNDLLTGLKIIFDNKSLNGFAKISYQQIKGIAVPVSTSGKSALEIRDSALIGLNFGLAGENFKINTGLSDQIFDPGF